MKMHHRVALSVLLLGSSLSSAPAQGTGTPKVRKEPAGKAALPAAPYVSPAVGTRYVYTNFTNVVTKTDGWRTWFDDPKRGPIVMIARLIPENAKVPLAIPDSHALKRLWPLRLGTNIVFHTSRGEEQQQWNLVVSDTETVTVPAGRFLTYRIDGTENSTLTRNPDMAVTNMTTWWYAPAPAAVVRVKFVQARGPRQGGVARNELLRIERP